MKFSHLTIKVKYSSSFHFYKEKNILNKKKVNNI